MVKLNEAKATGEDSNSIDPVVGAGGPVKKRLADANIQVDPDVDDIEDTVVTPQGSNDAGLKEAIDTLFGTTELSEDFKVKATVIFESVVNERVNALVEQKLLEKTAKLEASLKEEAEEVVENTTSQISQYIDYVAENWMKKNEVAIEAGYKVTMAESLYSGLVNLLKEHNFNLDEEATVTLEAAETRINEMDEKYNSVVNELLLVKEELLNHKKEKIFESVSNGLVTTDVDRFKSLTESITINDLNDYQAKIKIIKEHYFSTKPTSKELEVLEESNQDTGGSPVVTDPSMAVYLKALDRAK